MSHQSKREYFERIYWRYRQACRREKALILNEFCRVCGYNRKYAIRKLHGPPPEEIKARPRKPRGYTYAKQVISILEAIWAVAGYPWSVRLKALLPLWMPWIRRRYQVLPSLEQKLLAISARQMDRRFRTHKRLLRRRIYGRTKPGRWLKHQIPLRLDKWNIQQPGYVEVDLVSHSGNRAAGDFLYSLNLTDIYTGWVETRAVRGKGQRGVVAALDEIRKALPFPLYGIDSDNGSEFINAQLWQYCKRHQIQFTRGRPYKKDDNAHIEQKNWTHVRRLLGWERYEGAVALKALNDLYAGDLSRMMNLFQPSVKLTHKVRVGSQLRRRYDVPQTPLDRLWKQSLGKLLKVQALRKLRMNLDPFELAHSIDQQLEQIWNLAAVQRTPAEAQKPGRKSRVG
jgi:hypothetical protein